MTAARAKGVSIWTEARFLAAVSAAAAATTTAVAPAGASAPAAAAATTAAAAAAAPSLSTGDLGPLADGESKEVPGSG